MTGRTTNHEWLGLTVEEPLEPELPICDPHHHLWDRVSGRVAPRYLLYSASDKAKLFHDTAARVYRLTT
jgi:predicted TIM-barrel fold metal-dependent hydrolase